MEFYSHLKPEKILLKDHLHYVGNRSKEIVESKKFDKLDKNILGDVSYLIGVSHDFGKFTTFFQEKLKGLKDKKDPLTYHGLISALFVFEVVNKYITARNLDKEKPYRFLPLLAYFVIKHHHGNLGNIESDVNPNQLIIGFKNLNKQLEDIWVNKTQIKEEYRILLKNYQISTKDIFANLERYKREMRFSENIKPLIKEIDKSLYFFKKDNGEIIHYLLVMFFYSVLIDSDKKHAGHVREIERKKLPENLVENYLANKEFQEQNKSKINDIRNEIRKSVLKNITDSNTNQKIFTITAPTGTGKTLTSFSAALILRKKLKEELKLKYEPRIIYSLPFTSIIDQSYNVFDGVLDQIKDFKRNESEYLLKHHYLSEIFYKTEDIEKEMDIEESMALIESWESEIIVTTFIQLFYTLIGYKNRSLKKFHNIVNSIIILDEVQNIPIEYWQLVREILTAIAEYFNCRIILMTATKPLIFTEGKYKELVDDYESYFKKDELNRVLLKIDPKNKQVSELCDSLNNWSDNSYLFVFNTINSSLEFYKTITNRIQELGLAFKICYLSTNIIPKHRKQRIEKIREAIMENKKIIVVSTQIIEAGVDIDCDCVYRDMGPLDSIIQVAGRCNRNKRLEQADVHLLNLVNENNRPFTGIYDSTLLNIVSEILKNKSQISEKKFLELINEYFKIAKQKSQKEMKILDSILELNFYDKNPDNDKRKPISEFKLIKEDYFKVDVFIELDKEAEFIWKKYSEIRKLQPIERKKEFLKIKKEFYDYIISVPIKYKNDVDYDDDIGISHISLKEKEMYYNSNTGFKREDAGNGPLFG